MSVVVRAVTGEGRRWRALRAGAFLATAVLALAIVYLRNPSGPGNYPDCPFHWLTGLYCPGCGSLRALYELMHGHPLAALGFNPLMVLLLPFLTFSIASILLADLGLPRLPSVKLPPRLIALVPAAIVIYWILRNIPVYPFRLLAP